MQMFRCVPPRRRRLASMVAGALVLVILSPAAGCSSGDEASTTTAGATGDTTTTTVAVTTTTAPSTTTTSPDTTTTLATTTTGPLSSAETVLPDGNIRAMGFINQIRFDGVTNFIRIDYAEMLTGDEAIAAAVADGVIEPGEDLPNDYYISNVNRQNREFKVSDAVAITTSTWGGVMDRPITWEEFRSFWSLDKPPDGTHLSKVPWWIERQGDTVVKIDEQYLP